MFLKSILPNLQENILLADHTTFRIGGAAKYFFVAKNRQDFIAAIRAAKENSVPFFVMGGGSNLLASDEGFDGLIIKVQSDSSSVVLRSETTKDLKKIKIAVEAGVLFGKIIMETVKNNFSGAEWGFGIPGTIGGAICGNAGRLGQDISSVVESVKVLDENLNEKIIPASECGFDYRESRFKKTGEIILEAQLVFEKKNKSLIDKVLAQAKEVVFHSPPFPSAGCVFKNYKVGMVKLAAGASRFRPPTPALRLASDLRPLNSMADANQGSSRRPSLNTPAADSLLSSHPELAPRVRAGKIGVGHLIDRCGLKGRRIGGAKIWEGHANYIVNLGGAKATNVLALMKLCKEAVQEKYGIKLEEEAGFLGFQA